MTGPRDYHTKVKQVRQRKINIIWYHLHMESKIWHKWTMKQNPRHWEQICGCQGAETVGEGWIGSLGSADANYYILNGYTTRSYCIEQGTMLKISW